MVSSAAPLRAACTTLSATITGTLWPLPLSIRSTENAETPLSPEDDAWIYIRSMQWSQYGPLFESGGAPASSGSGWCDGMIAHNDSTKRMALFGGSCHFGLRCGAFACYWYSPVGAHYWSIVASPSYLPYMPREEKIREA